MSSIIDALYEIKYNPFEYGHYLASFYTSIDESENNFLLAPLIIPLCSHPFYSKKITNANKKSTIWSIFHDRSKLYDLQERVDEFKTLTDKCIQYCLINDWLSINSQKLSLFASTESEPVFLVKKSAENLGRLFNGHSVVEIYTFLGVKPR